mgnify:CR=1 FL=1
MHQPGCWEFTMNRHRKGLKNKITSVLKTKEIRVFRDKLVFGCKVLDLYILSKDHRVQRWTTWQLSKSDAPWWQSQKPTLLRVSGGDMDQSKELKYTSNQIFCHFRQFLSHYAITTTIFFFIFKQISHYWHTIILKQIKYCIVCVLHLYSQICDLLCVFQQLLNPNMSLKWLLPAIQIGVRLHYLFLFVFSLPTLRPCCTTWPRATVSFQGSVFRCNQPCRTPACQEARPFVRRPSV